jgi:hypothetical protein
MFKITRIVLLWFLVAIIACAIYAYASSTVPIRGGEGASRISGYVVTNVKYHLANEPSKIDIVEFNLDGPATVVKIKLVSADLNFHSCIHANAYHWRCEVNPAVDIASMDELRVIASDD